MRSESAITLPRVGMAAMYASDRAGVPQITSNRRRQRFIVRSLGSSWDGGQQAVGIVLLHSRHLRRVGVSLHDRRRPFFDFRAGRLEDVEPLAIGGQGDAVDLPGVAARFG